MTYNLELSDVLPATPQAIYDAWMSSDGHSAMSRNAGAGGCPCSAQTKS